MGRGTLVCTGTLGDMLMTFITGEGHEAMTELVRVIHERNSTQT
jgi:hypothetical protein